MQHRLDQGSSSVQHRIDSRDGTAAISDPCKPLPAADNSIVSVYIPNPTTANGLTSGRTNEAKNVDWSGCRTLVLQSLPCILGRQIRFNYLAQEIDRLVERDRGSACLQSEWIGSFCSVCGLSAAVHPAPVDRPLLGSAATLSRG